jgi:hypothetical protein
MVNNGQLRQRFFQKNGVRHSFSAQAVYVVFCVGSLTTNSNIADGGYEKRGLRELIFNPDSRKVDRSGS